MVVERRQFGNEKIGKYEVGVCLYFGALLIVGIGVHVQDLEMPSMELSLPKFTLPEMPEISLPDLPKISSEMPSMPELPEIPDLPEMPELPKLPEMPDMPEMPNIPDIMSMPSLSNIPDIDLNLSDVVHEVYNEAVEGVQDIKEGISDTLATLQKTVMEPFDRVKANDETGAKIIKEVMAESEELSNQEDILQTSKDDVDIEDKNVISKSKVNEEDMTVEAVDDSTERVYQSETRDAVHTEEVKDHSESIIGEEENVDEPIEENLKGEFSEGNNIEEEYKEILSENEDSEAQKIVTEEVQSGAPTETFDSLKEDSREQASDVQDTVDIGENYVVEKSPTDEVVENTIEEVSTMENVVETVNKKIDTKTSNAIPTKSKKDEEPSIDKNLNIQQTASG